MAGGMKCSLISHIQWHGLVEITMNVSAVGKAEGDVLLTRQSSPR